MRFISCDNELLEVLESASENREILARSLFKKMKAMNPGDTFSFATDFVPVNGSDPCGWYGVYRLDREIFDCGRAWMVCYYSGTGIGVTSRDEYDEETAIDHLVAYFKENDIYGIAVEV